MRVVYGAGAVAALSVMAVGLVQPDYAATADQPASDPTTEPNAVAQGQAPVEIRHVTRYIHLKPGQTAPPGATVIAATAPTPRVVVTHNSVPGSGGQSAGNGGQLSQPAPRPPQPKPVTHQSGKPR
jgi:hypothetical protein